MNTDEWFSDRVCDCPRFAYDMDYDWQREFEIFQTPPVDPQCGKWLNRIMTCCKCHNQFYQFFRHPGMGYHPNVGWYCWNCLEMYSPPVIWHVMAAKSKVPPPQIILPPGITLYKREKLW